MVDETKLDGRFAITDSDHDEEGQLENVEIGGEEDVDVGLSSLSVNNGQAGHKGRWKEKKNSCILALSLILMVVIVAALALWGGRARGDESDAMAGREREKVVPPSRAVMAAAVALIDNKATSDEEGNNQAMKESQQWYITPPNDPIPASIRLIDPSVMDGYPTGEEGCMALTGDIYNASAILANEVIKRNAQYSGRRFEDRRRYYRSSPSVEDTAGGDEKSGGKKGEDAYGTNNQETGVDEADIIKSDGKHVFVAYGDILVVWDKKTGEEMSRTKMPERKPLSSAEGGYEYEYDLNRKARISGLLLDSASKRIAVIVSGYASRYRYDYPFQPVLSDKGDTRVLLYAISSLPIGDGSSELPLISSEGMDGEYCSARKIHGVAHIVRQSNVETYNHITHHLSRYHDDYALDSKEMYVKHATSRAKLILPGFAQRLTEELKVIRGGTDCSAVTRVALYASVGDNDNTQEGFPDSVASALLKSYLQVSSFEIASPPKEERSSLVPMSNTIGSFFPSSNSEIYASEDVLIVAGRGYYRDTFTRSWAESTYFLSYKLHDDGSTPTGLVIGKTPGYLLNQFSMDEYKGYFRVATTERTRWACIPVDPGTVSRRTHHWPHCSWERASESKSQLAVMKFPQESGEMELINVIDNLGVTEEIKSVRFLDDKAYLVTFMRTDPLYAIDFRDPMNPVVADELKISGFSSYLHPVGDDRLLAIGKEANEKTGLITGFQITLFDVSDLNSTKVLQRYTIDQRWASSQAETDHLAFRYLPLSKLLILPISINTSWQRRVVEDGKVEDVDGFKVFSVTDEKIENRFSISMTSSSSIKRGCWYDAYLSPRSMVFDGDLTAVKGHGYLSYDLETEKMRWSQSLDENNAAKCYSYWG